MVAFGSVPIAVCLLLFMTVDEDDELQGFSLPMLFVMALGEMNGSV